MIIYNTTLKYCSDKARKDDKDTLNPTVDALESIIIARNNAPKPKIADITYIRIRFIRLLSSRTKRPVSPLTMTFTSPFIRLQFSVCNFAATASFRDFGRKKGAAVRKIIQCCALALFHMKRTDHTRPVLLRLNQIIFQLYAQK